MISHSGTKLSALIVNYESGAFAEGCWRSLRAAWRAEGRDAHLLEAVVVDNASPSSQEPWLSRLEQAGARVLRRNENGGYASGINAAFALSSGGPRDAVAVLNPDVAFLPGSLGVLLDYLARNPEVGAVAPAAFIDPTCHLALPRHAMPTPRELLRTMRAARSPRSARRYAEVRHRSSLAWWTAREPLATDFLSGACLFLRREVVGELGFFFDERYPLYFEDTDLCRRILALGRTLVHHPGARILHHWARSTGAGGEARPEVAERWRKSRQWFLARHFGPRCAEQVERAERRILSGPEQEWFQPIHPIAHLGELRDPVAVEFPRAARFAMEIGLAPVWILAVGVLGEGARWRCARESWEWFFSGRYYLRALDQDSGELLGAWSFDKSAPARSEPCDLREIGLAEPPAP